MTAGRPAILSIQSHVAYGHVGNSAAVLPLQRLGFEVMALNTVDLAHHPGYGRFAGRVSDPAMLMQMLDGLERIGALDSGVAVLSGYLGTAGTAEVVERAVGKVRERRSDALFCCDPVIGDRHSGIFVEPAIPSCMRERLAPLADVLTPNAFELGVLTERVVDAPQDALTAADVLRSRGTGMVIATGLPLPDAPGHLGVLAVDGKGAWLVTAPWHDVVLHGTGDAFSALFLGHLLRARSVPDALRLAVGAMAVLVERTLQTGQQELALIAAQDAFLRPEPELEVERLR